MYTGIKKFISQYKKPFDRIGKATKKAKGILKDRGDKLTKALIEEEVNLILEEWNIKTQKGIDAHTLINNKEMKKNPDIIYEGYVKYEEAEENDKLIDTSINKLSSSSIYIEKKIVSNHHMLIGYADKVEVTKDNFINIEDYKSWDKLYRSSSYVVENGFKIAPSFFFSPINHLQDTNYSEACLQLSLYMYILWTYNKKLKPGSLKIRHIKLNEEGLIIDEEYIEVPYLREEVKAMLKNKKQILG